ncbi:MAG: NAD(P)-dependent oxidoreductase [bacterium]
MTTTTTTVLVTGGAGYIGSVLIGQLLAGGYSVRTIDNLIYGGESLLPYITHPRFEFCRGDIRQARDVTTALKGVAAVVHLAAVVGDKACRQNESLAVAVNRDASRMLYEQARETGVERFVFASTCSNYGVSRNSDTPVDETAPLHPVSLYAELKVGFEQYLKQHHGRRPAVTCLRFATAYGLSSRPRFDLTVNEFTRDLLAGLKLEIYCRRSWRPYCHAVDLARACVAVLQSGPELVAGQTFNVGDSSENYRKESVVELILKELSLPDDRVSFVDRTDDPRDYRVDCRRIGTELGFSVTRKVPDGIREIASAIASGLIDNPRDPRYRNI